MFHLLALSLIRHVVIKELGEKRILDELLILSSLLLSFLVYERSECQIS